MYPVCGGETGSLGRIRTGVVPRQELGEEGVVVGQRLAGGGGVVGSLTGRGERGQLSSGLLVLLLGLVGDGTCSRAVGQQPVALAASGGIYIPLATES